MAISVKTVRIPVIMRDCQLPEMARLAVAARSVVGFHPLFQGFRSRVEDWGDPAWRPLGGFHVLLLVQDGRVDLDVAGGSRSIGPGTAFLLRPDAIPGVHFVRGVRYHETYFRISDSSREYRCAEPLHFRPRAWALALAIDALADAIREDAEGLVAKHWLALVLAEFHTLDESAGSEARLLSQPQRAAAIRWAREHLHLPAESGEMARVAGLSPDYFARLFRNTFGMAPRDWIVRERIREACRLLDESSLRSKEIAHRLGYESPSSFGRQFRQVMGGVSPARYRLRAQRPRNG